MDEEAATIAYYDALAAHYDACLVDWDGAIDRHGGLLQDIIETELDDGPLTILDAACGIGTQSLGLASKGHEVTGIDASSQALRRAAIEAQRRGVRLTLRKGDLRRVHTAVRGPVDVIICVDNSLAHLTHLADITAAAASMRTAVSEQGLVIVGIRDYDRHNRRRPTVTTPVVTSSAGAARLAFQRWHWLDRHRYEVEQFLLTDHGTGWETTCFRGAVVRAVTRAELSGCFTVAGFRVRWIEPDASGFHQPLLVARPMLDSPEAARLNGDTAHRSTDKGQTWQQLQK